MALRIGVDLGGTKIEAIALDDAGREVFRKRMGTPRGDYEATLQAVRSLVTEAGQGSVGIGIPGALSQVTGMVKNANSTWLIGKPLKQDLETALGREVRIENDANCFALSEAVDGAGKGAEVVFGVILGTGVGGGIVVRGQALVGPNQVAGEWGHNPLPWMTPDEYPGEPCYCGRAGCIETWVSGPGFERDHLHASGQASSAPQIVRLAEQGDVRAGASLDRYRSRLARALASLVNVLDPDVIVLGGGMSNVASLAEDVHRLLPRWVFSDSVSTRVARNVHGDSSGVRGAAWLWPA